jgi:hypothetical protein
VARRSRVVREVDLGVRLPTRDRSRGLRVVNPGPSGVVSGQDFPLPSGRRVTSSPARGVDRLRRLGANHHRRSFPCSRSSRHRDSSVIAWKVGTASRGDARPSAANTTEGATMAASTAATVNNVRSIRTGVMGSPVAVPGRAELVDGALVLRDRGSDTFRRMSHALGRAGGQSRTWGPGVPPRWARGCLM